MRWIDKNIKMPPMGEFEWATIYVLVTDGRRIGYGHYDYDSKHWVYEMAGYCEQNDNNITHWMKFPDLPL
jgi:hypothetical protein